jgi:hypothetical protein
MYAKLSTVAGVLAALLCLVVGHAQSTPSGAADWIGKRLSSRRASFFYGTKRFGASSGRPWRSAPAASDAAAVQPAHALDISTHFSEGGGLLPMWTYDIRATRDGLHYQGAIVGHSPFEKPGTDRIPTFIVPLVIRTHRIAASMDPTTFNFNIVNGDTTVDPTAPDHNCLPAPTNVPATVLQQSPVFTPTKFVFGGTDVGTTQYLDAHQRATFWNVLGSKVDDYHVLLDPVRITAPVFLDVPPNEGLSINDPNLLESFGFTICTPIQIINFYWLDSYLEATVIPGLAAQGVDTASLPVFLQYNGYTQVDVTNLLAPGALGYHNFTGNPFGTQTYAVVDFDRSNLFLGPSDGLGTDILSHEVGEWGNDPYGMNATPSFGNTGQVIGCQSNFEVGDPLSGTAFPDITMPNGLVYHLQELAFFSWFYGAPSIAANGWYSNNATFKTDAGHVCP